MDAIRATELVPVGDELRDRGATQKDIEEWCGQAPVKWERLVVIAEKAIPDDLENRLLRWLHGNARYLRDKQRDSLGYKNAAADATFSRELVKGVAPYVPDLLESHADLAKRLSLVIYSIQDLMPLDLGVNCLQEAYENGLTLSMKEGAMVIRRGKGSGVPREQSKKAFETLQDDPYYTAMESIIKASSDNLYGMMAESQRCMSEAQDWLIDELDRWDRLEKVCRLLWGKPTECIAGSSGCLPDAIVKCDFCVEQPVKEVKKKNVTSKI